MSPARKKSSRGRISRGLETDGLVKSAVDFIERQLPRWRDDPERRSETAEEKLNSQLSKFLDVRARNEFPMAYFHHEEPQPKRRRIDISASPTETTLIKGKSYTIYDPFLVIEGKRLPAPSPDREREYVTGFSRVSGGIQRFKLQLHGPGLNTAVMVGYIQAEGARHWWTRINSWIVALADGARADGCRWRRQEILMNCHEDTEMRTARAQSVHGRQASGQLSEILLIHLWIAM